MTAGDRCNSTPQFLLCSHNKLMALLGLVIERRRCCPNPQPRTRTEITRGLNFWYLPPDFFLQMSKQNLSLDFKMVMVIQLITSFNMSQFSLYSQYLVHCLVRYWAHNGCWLGNQSCISIRELWAPCALIYPRDHLQSPRACFFFFLKNLLYVLNK